MSHIARNVTIFLIDGVCVNVALFLAFIIRFNQSLGFMEVWDLYTPMILPVTLIRLPLFCFFGLYPWSFRYASRNDAIRVFLAVTSGTLVLIAFVAFFFFHEFSTTIGRSVLLIDYLVCLIGAMVFRFAFRDFVKIVESFKERRNINEFKKVLIVGADYLGELLARDFLRRPDLRCKPVGFVDNNPGKKGVGIHGIKVYGSISQLCEIIRKRRADEVVIALSEADGEQIKQITTICRDLDVACRIVPQLSSLFTPKLLPLNLREVDATDILGRDIVQVDQEKMKSFFEDKSVLITGAGGSIGSEIVKLLVQINVKELILVDNCENNLYEIQTELAGTPSGTKVRGYLCDVTHKRELEAIFEQHKPDVVYHGAAYKHVPLLEEYFSQGIRNNVLGTKTVADLSLKYNVQSFILISSDKAIRPKSLMGATKRIAELYIQSLVGGNTRFIAVRFGNVLKSKGSVVPLFKKQLETGRELTITHPDMTRYFMDISESVCLIVQATLLGSSSEIFVLDMGKPIKIVDLAYGLAQLMGIPSNEVRIKYIGLRPGEKLEEEIESDCEQAIPTTHKKIKIWESLNKPLAHVTQEIEELLLLIQENISRKEAISKIQKIVPEYQAWFSENDSAADLKIKNDAILRT